jgi:hypothetical protein
VDNFVDMLPATRAKALANQGFRWNARKKSKVGKTYINQQLGVAMGFVANPVTHLSRDLRTATKILCISQFTNQNRRKSGKASAAK